MSELMYLIWSNEHQAWWMPNHSGYTTISERAGRYTKAQAEQICNGANYGWDEERNPNELPVDEEIACRLISKHHPEVKDKKGTPDQEAFNESLHPSIRDSIN